MECASNPMTREYSDSGGKNPSSETAAVALNRRELKRWLKWIVLVTTVMVNAATVVEKTLAVVAWLLQVV
jgi:hypothetical protein